jgi:hypothetical protein
MRTTIRLHPDVLAAAKKLAVDTDRTLTEVIEDALREVIARRREPDKRRRIRLPVFGKGGPRPGVDLNCNASLLDLMESPDGSS